MVVPVVEGFAVISSYLILAKAVVVAVVLLVLSRCRLSGLKNPKGIRGLGFRESPNRRFQAE